MKPSFAEVAYFTTTQMAWNAYKKAMFSHDVLFPRYSSFYFQQYEAKRYNWLPQPCSERATHQSFSYFQHPFLFVSCSFSRRDPFYSALLTVSLSSLVLQSDSCQIPPITTLALWNAHRQPNIRAPETRYILLFTSKSEFPQLSMEQSILRMETELQKQYGNEDWSTTFRAGPDSIGILAECILITSRPMVIGIELKGPGLACDLHFPIADTPAVLSVVSWLLYRYTTLSANVSHCAAVGADTFRTTARNMKILAHLTNELSQPNGTVR